MKLSQARLKEVLRYSPIVGVFEWRVAGRRIRPGFLAGGPIGDGYIGITVDGRRYPVHVLAWLYMTGEMPSVLIDHIDGDKSNNAFGNLRLATHSQNSCNARVNAANKSGVKGVFFVKSSGKWRARLRKAGEVVFDKCFDSIEDARDAITAARSAIHGEFANHGLHGYISEELDSK